MKHIVKSREGIEFVVESDPKSAAYDVTFAAMRPAAELALHGDFVKVGEAAPEFVFEGPRIVGPLERRAAFKVIKGGKQP